MSALHRNCKISCNFGFVRYWVWSGLGVAAYISWVSFISSHFAVLEISVDSCKM
jgi:hypothetical protein